VIKSKKLGWEFRKDQPALGGTKGSKKEHCAVVPSGTGTETNKGRQKNGKVAKAKAYNTEAPVKNNQAKKAENGEKRNYERKGETAEERLHSGATGTELKKKSKTIAGALGATKLRAGRWGGPGVREVKKITTRSRIKASWKSRGN